MEEKTFTSDDYFHKLKDNQEVMTEENLNQFQLACLRIGKQFKDTGQTDGLNRILFLLYCIEKEKKLLDVGINQYISKTLIQRYIDSISDDDVSIIELSKFPRVIPYTIQERVQKCKDIFDNMYVLYTDYSEDRYREIKRADENRDPILFGTFEKGNLINERFYIIGDWEDKYCHLTLQKMIDVCKDKGVEDIVSDLDTSYYKELEGTLKTSKVTKELWWKKVLDFLFGKE